MNFKSLSDSFGLETNEADVARPLSGAEFAELEQAFFAGQVLVLRG